MEEILKTRMFAEGEFQRVGVWKDETFAKRRAEELRESGKKVRTVAVPTSRGMRYVNYIK